MSVRDLYASVTNTSTVKQITLTESMSQPTVTVEIVAAATTLEVGNSCTIDFGYSDEHAAFLTGGTVKDVRQRHPQNDYVILVHDVLSKAVDFFIAPDDPEGAYRANNISAENLVRDLLAMAEITNYTGDASGFTFGVQQDNDNNKILLVTAWQAIENICRICGFTVYADSTGQVHFSQRKPYIVGGDASEHDFTTGDSGDLLEIEYLKSEEKLRNRVVCYGAPGIKASAESSSPYLPSATFRKSLVVSHELIDTQAMAQRAADVNLQLFNRLTENCVIKAKGKPSIRARDIVAVVESFTGLTASDLWVVFSASHTLDQNGYSMSLNLVR